MTNKQIKNFYLSLIDNEEAKWSMTKREEGESTWTLFTCKIAEITVEVIPNYKLVFTHHNNDKSWLSTRSDAVTFSDIGISKFRLLFPYFGVASRIKRRITTDINNKTKIESTQKLKSVSEVLSKDKAFARDLKLKQLDIE